VWLWSRLCGRLWGCEFAIVGGVLLFISYEREDGGYEVMIKGFLLRLIEVVSVGELNGVGQEYELLICFLASLPMII